MAIKSRDLVLPPELEEDTNAILQAMAGGKPLDAGMAQRIRERGDQIREEVKRKHGTLDIGVSAIRELRGELPNP